MFRPSFEGIDPALLAQVRQNCRVSGWEMLGEKAPKEFEPYFTVRVTNDHNSPHYFWDSMHVPWSIDNFDEFASNWIKANFPDGLPTIAPGYLYRITWMPTYTFKPMKSGTLAAFVDYDDQYFTNWRPTLVAVSEEEFHSPWYYVWDEDCWIEHPIFISPEDLQEKGVDISDKHNMTRHKFVDFNFILFMYSIKNFYPSWWDWE